MFTVASFFFKQLVFFDKFYLLSVTKASMALGIPGILTQGAVRLATDNMPLANPHRVVLIAFLYFTCLGAAAKRKDLLHDFSREAFTSFHLLCFFTVVHPYSCCLTL